VQLTVLWIYAAGALDVCRQGDLRFHFSRASRSWIRNASRGGLPILASGLHMYAAARPNRARTLSSIRASWARSALTSKAESPAKVYMGWRESIIAPLGMAPLLSR
jgi:hypothetical protein